MPLFSRARDVQPVTEPEPKPPITFAASLSSEVIADLDHLLSQDSMRGGEPSLLRETYLCIKGGGDVESIIGLGHHSASNVRACEYALHVLCGTETLHARRHEAARYLASRLTYWLTEGGIGEQTIAHLRRVLLQAESLVATRTAAATVQPLSAAAPPNVASTGDAELSIEEEKAEPVMPGVERVGAGIYVYSYPSLLRQAQYSNRPPLLRLGAEPETPDLSPRPPLAVAEPVHEADEVLMLLRAWPSRTPFQEADKFHAVLKAGLLWRQEGEDESGWFEVPIEMLDALAQAFDLASA